MKPAWTPDFEVDAAMAMGLIKRIFPELRVERLELLGIGWDNSAYLADGRYVFRFPRRSVAAGLMNTEMVHMPDIAAHLTLPVPIPTLIGPPTTAYPYPFSGHRFIPGVTACSVTLSHNERCEIAIPLAGFLRELHDIEVRPSDLRFAPRDEIGRTDLSKRLTLLYKRLNRHETTDVFEGIDTAGIRRLAEDLARTPPSDSPLCWIHGDLYARHLLVDDAHRFCGVIDWGDVHLGDSALDLSIVYSFLHDEARTEFFDSYGEVDNNTLRRARFRALNYGVILVEYGSEIGDGHLVDAGKNAIENLLKCEK